MEEKPKRVICKPSLEVIKTFEGRFYAIFDTVQNTDETSVEYLEHPYKFLRISRHESFDEAKLKALSLLYEYEPCTDSGDCGAALSPEPNGLRTYNMWRMSRYGTEVIIAQVSSSGPPVILYQPSEQYWKGPMEKWLAEQEAVKILNAWNVEGFEIHKEETSEGVRYWRGDLSDDGILIREVEKRGRYEIP